MTFTSDISPADALAPVRGCKTIACYTLVGVLFGLLFPFVGMASDVLILRPGIGGLAERVRTNPIHGIVALAPLVLGAMFFVIGRIQLALREKNAHLKEALARAQSADHAKDVVLATVADGIVCVSEDGRITTFSRSAEGIFGYTAEEVMGRPVTMLLPDDGADALDFVAHHSPQEEARNLESRPIIAGKRRSGAIFPMEIGLKRSAQQGEGVFVAVVRDITEREKVETLKNEFIATVSHELRTPLTSIYGPLSIIRSGKLGALSGPGEKTVDIALRNCQHLLALINNLLDFEKISSGRAKIDLQPHGVGRLVTEAVQDNEGFAMSREVSMRITPCPDEARIRVDEDRFGQILRNLLSNALKFSEAGKTVDVEVRAESGEVVVSVADRGIGIPADKFDRIFRRFSQVDGSATRTTSGTGLGLAISRELTEQMGGRIGFSSDFGRGSTFWVAFPLLSEDGQSTPAFVPPPPRPAGDRTRSAA